MLWLIAVGIVRDRIGAEDVVQEAAIVALDKWDQFETGSSFKAWMGQIVRYVALNHARSEHKRRATGLDPVQLEHMSHASPDVPDPAGLTVGLRGELPGNQRHFDDHVMAALGELSDVARACLLLRTLEGLDYTEISDLMDIPAGTAMSHVHRSRQAMRRFLTEKVEVQNE